MNMFVVVFAMVALPTRISFPISIDDVERLCTEECHFDFCGIGSSLKVSDNQVGISRSRIKSLIEYGCDNYEVRRRFLSATQSLEYSMFHGKSNDVVNAARRVEAMLDVEKQCSSTNFNYKNLLLMHIEMVEYSLARVVNFKTNVAGLENVVLKVLPNSLFEPISRTFDGSALQHLLVFRNLLCIGIRVQLFLSEEGALPKSLSEIDMLPDLTQPIAGMKVLYSIQDDAWQLLCAGKHVRTDAFSFDVYVPLLRGRPAYKWRYRNAIWFSGSYSKKRLSLYRGETLNEGTCWACKMVNGYVIGPSW